MIEKVECIVITCDICEDVYENVNGFSVFPDENYVDPADDGWYTHKGEGCVHYCPSCHEYDDEDNLIVKSADKGGGEQS